MQQVQRSAQRADGSRTVATDGEARSPQRTRWSGRSRRLAGLVKAVAVAATVGSVSVAVPAPAQAATSTAPSKIGCRYYHHVADWRIIPIYTGSFCAYIGKRGEFGINKTGDVRVKGSFDSFSYRLFGSPTACHFWVDLDIYDPSGPRYFHSQGTQVNPCSDAKGSTYNRSFASPVSIRPSSEVCATVWRRRAGAAGEEVIITHARICGVVS